MSQQIKPIDLKEFGITGKPSLGKLINEFSDFYFNFGLYGGDQSFLILINDALFTKITATDDHDSKAEDFNNYVLFEVEDSQMIEDFLSIGDNREHYDELAEEDDEHLKHYIIHTPLLVYELLTLHEVNIDAHK